MDVLCKQIFLACFLDGSDITKGNLKLILGLIWTLILKYQISMPMMDDDDGESRKNITPKQALMGWVKSKLPPEVCISRYCCFFIGE